MNSLPLLRVVATFKNSRKTLILHDIGSITLIKETFLGSFNLHSHQNCILWNPILNAEIDDPMTIFMNDEIELKLEGEVQEHEKLLLDDKSSISEEIQQNLTEEELNNQVSQKSDSDKGNAFKVELTNIETKTFNGDRHDLAQEINEWAHSNKFHLIYTEKSRIRKKVGDRLHILRCNKCYGDTRKLKDKTDQIDEEPNESKPIIQCSFFRMFSQVGNEHKLIDYWNEHSH